MMDHCAALAALAMYVANLRDHSYDQRFVAEVVGVSFAQESVPPEFPALVAWVFAEPEMPPETAASITLVSCQAHG